MFDEPVNYYIGDDKCKKNNMEGSIINHNCDDYDDEESCPASSCVWKIINVIKSIINIL